MRNSCKICGNGKITEVLDLGVMPSANNLVKRSELRKVQSFPLKYYTCGRCSLFQQMKFQSGSYLFTNYLYLTGVNKALVEHFKEMTSELYSKSVGKELAFVIGSNDGTEVNLLKEMGFSRAVGIEPSNIAEIARKNGRETVNAFFTSKLSRELAAKYGHADLITANNVFAHIEDPRDMLKGMSILIKNTGIISIEVHWLKSLVDKLEIETLYAEHYFVWSIKSMRQLIKSMGLRLADVVYMPKQHGGSLRFIITKRSNAESLMDNKQVRGRKMRKLETMERRAGLYSPAKMMELQKRAEIRKSRFLSIIDKFRKKGKSVAIWSVPAKVPTLINYYGLTNKEIDCAYEISKTKIGKYIPKANIRIKDERFINTDKPDYLIIGAWNYMNIAKDKLKVYVRNGGILINPLNCEIIKR